MPIDEAQESEEAENTKNSRMIAAPQNEFDCMNPEYDAEYGVMTTSQENFARRQQLDEQRIGLLSREGPR